MYPERPCHLLPTLARHLINRRTMIPQLLSSTTILVHLLASATSMSPTLKVWISGQLLIRSLTFGTPEERDPCPPRGSQWCFSQPHLQLQTLVCLHHATTNVTKTFRPFDISDRNSQNAVLRTGCALGVVSKRHFLILWELSHKSSNPTLPWMSNQTRGS